MGVNLKDLFEHPETRMDEFNGKRLAIDAFNIAYQFLTSIRQPDGTPLMDSKGNITSHLSGLFYRSINFIEAGIQPIYVFDGEPPDFKAVTIEKRKEKKRQAAESYERAVKEGEMGSLRMYAQQTAVLTEDMVEESKKLLSAMGIPSVQAIGEGEAQAAQMAAKGEAYASVSQDYDSLLFGSPILVRNLSITGKRKLPRRNDYVMVLPERIPLEENLKRLGITREQLVWIAVMVGTDYNSGIKGVGPKTAYKLVQKYNSFEEISKYVEEKYGMGFPYNIDKIMGHFLDPPYTEKFKLDFGKPDPDKISTILSEEHEFSKDRIGQGIKRLDAALNVKIKQSTLSFE